MIHQKELEVLNILWKSNRPLMVFEIVERGENMSQSTAQYVLRKLVNDGLIEVAGTGYSNNVLSRKYKPTDLSKKLVLDQYLDQFEAISNIISVDDVIAGFIDRKV